MVSFHLFFSSDAPILESVLVSWQILAVSVSTWLLYRYIKLLFNFIRLWDGLGGHIK